MITAAHVQHVFASHHLALRRFASSPELCDRRMCSSLDIAGGRFVYLAAAPRTDFMVVVFATPKDAIRAAGVSATGAVRRQNTLLLYLSSATARLALVRRIFQST